MADLFKLMISNWACYSKDEKSDLIARYSTRRERRKFKGRDTHISELSIFKDYKLP